MGLRTSRFANTWFQIKQMGVIFTHLKLGVAVARHFFKWVKISIILFSVDTLLYYLGAVYFSQI